MKTLEQVVMLNDSQRRHDWLIQCANVHSLIVIDHEPLEIANDDQKTFTPEDVFFVAQAGYTSKLEAFVDDRATLRMIPGAGEPFQTIGYQNLTAIGDLPKAKQYLELAATLTNGDLGYQLNAAIANEWIGDPVHAELYARQALAVQPGDEGFYEILIDALRQQKRFGDAFAVFPRAMAAIKKPRNHDGRDRACLLDVMLTYTLAGKTDEALGLLDRFASIIADEHRALAAIIHLQRGDAAQARELWRVVGTKKTSGEGVIQHARALFALAQGKPDNARMAVKAAWDAHYTDMAWLAQDKRLAKYVPKKRKVKR